MSTEPQYANFDLQILRQGTGYVARVMASPKGEGSASFELPQLGLEAENMRLLGGKRGTVRALDAHVGNRAKDIGEALFLAAFRGDVLDRFNESRAWARVQKKRLRIRLRLDKDSQQLPWEYLRAPGDGGKQLGLDRETPLVRYIEMAEPAARPRVEGALKVLVVISSPTDRDDLDVEAEWKNIERALGGLMQTGAVKAKRLQPPTFKALAQELERDDYHVFHFVGHGGWDEQTQEGVLVFTREDGREQLIGSDLLGPILGAKESLQLAVLNACEGAVSKGKDIFAGSAHRLVGQGTPAVVAMQAEITDEAAVDFSAGFYSSLAAGRPVDAAVTDGRRSIWAEPNPFEWGTPVLYMRAGDGMLFEVAEPAPSAAVVTVPKLVPPFEPPVVPRPPVIYTPPPPTGPDFAAVMPAPTVGLPFPTSAPAPGMVWWRKAIAFGGGALLLLGVIGSLNGGSREPTALSTEAPFVAVETFAPVTAAPTPLATTQPTPAATATVRATATPVPLPVTDIRNAVVNFNVAWVRALYTLDGNEYQCCAASDFLNTLVAELQDHKRAGEYAEATPATFDWIGDVVQLDSVTYAQRTTESWALRWYSIQTRIFRREEKAEVHRQYYTVRKLSQGWRVIGITFE